jgi:hypothetical protein
MSDIDALLQQLKQAGFAGEIDTSAEGREFYSHDASMFELRPQAILAPRDSKDLQ